MTPNPDTRRVYLGMPAYSGCSGGSSRAFWKPGPKLAAIGGRDVPIVVEHDYRQGSLLGATFNTLWCGALNMSHRGERVDYFAMLHSDCEPQDGWLELLIEELEAQDLDVLGVVAPIKDPRGLSSIALQNPQNPWKALCRLTMTEIFGQLPATFTQAHTGHPLLLNTGCWICRFDESWARQVHFSVHDRIQFSEDRGYYQEHEPEDWFFSRQCNALGLRLGATRKIRMLHAGENRWHNGAPWGTEQFDSEYVTESVLPRRTDGFVFPFDVPGWLLPYEGESLVELARGRRVLEIGSYCGKSTICLARSAECVTAIDPFDGRATPDPIGTFKTFTESLERYGVAGKVYPFIGTTAEAREAHTSEQGKYDLAFIDGDHEYDAVLADIAFASEMLAPDGLLVFHDYRRCFGEHDGGWDEGVTRAVNELLAGGGELISNHATLAVVKPPAAIPLEV